MSTDIVPGTSGSAQNYDPRISTEAEVGATLVAEDIVVKVTNEYVSKFIGHPVPDASAVRRDLIGLVNTELRIVNTSLDREDKIRLLKALAPIQVAMLLMGFHNVVRIVAAHGASGRANPILGFYVDDQASPHFGTYSTVELELQALAGRYWMTMDGADWARVRSILLRSAPELTQCTDRDLVPVNNGVFNYKTRELLPFSPGRVFLNKVRTDLVKDAASPVLHHEDGVEWEIETWLTDLFDDPEVAELLWQIIGATVRPYVRWNKAALFYAPGGSNGKGTILEMLENLMGEDGSIPMAIADFSESFGLEELLRGGPIFGHENDVGEFMKRSAAVKAVITGDRVKVTRKNLRAVDHQHFGFMIQCLNALPKFKDKSESLLRRFLPVPFTKRFVGTIERREIKHEFMARPDVLQYVLKRVLLDMPSYYQLSEPAASLRLLGELRENNDPVVEFWNEFESQFVWDLVPFPFMHDLYVSWFRSTNPSGLPVGSTAFADSLAPLIEASDRWGGGRRHKARTGNKLSHPEPLVAEYDLTRWSDQNYGGRDRLKKCIPSEVKSSYYCIVRIPGGAVAPSVEEVAAELAA